MDFRLDQEQRLLDAARAAIRGALRGQPAGQLECPDEALLAPAGCFVSLHESGNHRLRGCLGRIDATKPLWHCVQQSAVGVLDDPRFRDERVRLDELPNLEIEISVLSPPRAVASPLNFDPKTDGIYLHHGRQSGCFLPQVARDTGWTREKLLAVLCVEKLGLQSTAWQEPEARLEVFSTRIIGPQPFEPR